MITNNYPNWLVSVEQAKRLKEIGFDKECHFFYNFYEDVNELCCYSDISEEKAKALFPNEYNKNSDGYYMYLSIPSHEQVFEWFREKGLESMIDFHCVIELIVKTGYKYRIFSMKNLKLIENDFFIEKYEEVREALINKLIEVYEEDVDDKPIEVYKKLNK